MKLLKDIISFPGPQAVSVEFGRVHTKIVLLRRGRAAACAAAETTISDPAGTAEFIKSFLAERAPGCRRAYLTLPENEVSVRHLEIPAVQASKIRGVAEWQLKDELPGGAESHEIAWEITGELAARTEERKYRLAVLTASGGKLSVYLDLLSSCGLRTELVSYAPFNYGRILRAGGAATSAVDAVLDVGEEDSFICIYKGGRLVFLRRLPFSCRKLAASLTTSFTAGSRKVEYSMQEALRINGEFGIVRDEGVQIDGDVHGSHIISLMRPVLENLLRDIKASFSYFRSSSGDGAARRLILAGAGADIKDLGLYLAKELGIGYSLFPPVPACAMPAGEEKAGRFLSAAGAGVRDDSGADLLPPVLKSGLVAEKRCRAVCVSVVSALAALFAVFFYDGGKTGVYRKEIAGYSARLQSLEGIRAVKSVIEAAGVLMGGLRADNVPPDAVLKAVSCSAGGNIYLDELSLNSGKQELILKGTVNAPAQDAQRPLSEFADALKATGMFPDISLKYSSSGQEASGFEMTCRFAKKAL